MSQMLCQHPHRQVAFIPHRKLTQVCRVTIPILCPYEGCRRSEMRPCSLPTSSSRPCFLFRRRASMQVRMDCPQEVNSNSTPSLTVAACRRRPTTRPTRLSYTATQRKHDVSTDNQHQPVPKSSRPTLRGGQPEQYRQTRNRSNGLRSAEAHVYSDICRHEDLICVTCTLLSLGSRYLVKCQPHG